MCLVKRGKGKDEKRRRGEGLYGSKTKKKGGAYDVESGFDVFQSHEGVFNVVFHFFFVLIVNFS